LVSDHVTEPASEALAPPVLCASAPKVTTVVAALVLAAFALPVQGVPEAADVHEYVRASPAVGGVPTEGPPVPEKSVVILTVMVPEPPVLVVRTL
jgi:hypothetical protein